MKTVILTIFLNVVVATGLFGHPVHVSVSNIEYYTDSGRIDFSIKLYYDDFQSWINHKYNTLLNFAGQSRMTSGEQQAIEDYISENLHLLDHENNALSYIFKGWKVEEGSVWLLFCAYSEEKMHTITVKNTILLDLFADQVNLVILQIDNKQAGFEFNKRDIIYTFGK